MNAHLTLNDGDEIGVDSDGNVICWNATECVAYNCGEPPTPEITDRIAEYLRNRSL